LARSNASTLATISSGVYPGMHKLRSLTRSMHTSRSTSIKIDRSKRSLRSRLQPSAPRSRYSSLGDHTTSWRAPIERVRVGFRISPGVIKARDRNDAFAFALASSQTTHRGRDILKCCR
jgi:hypothetical protein